MIIGAGGHAVSLTETAVAAGYDIVGYVGKCLNGERLLNKPVQASLTEEERRANPLFCVAIGDNFTRERVLTDLLSEYPITRFPPLVHPSASVSSLARVGNATVIMQGAAVGSAATIGMGCILNTASVLEHESTLSDFASLAPGAITGGQVKIGHRTAVGIGAVIKHGQTIGSDTLIGAASYVNEDISSGVVAFGSPASVRRHREPSDPYLH